MSWWSEFWGPSATSLLYRVIANQETIMGLVEDLNAQLDAATTSIAGIAMDVTALKDQIELLLAGGTGISQADGEALLVKATALAASASGLDAATP